MLYIQEKEGLCYLSSENKGADQLHGYQNPVFTCCRSSNIGLLHLNFAAIHYAASCFIMVPLRYERTYKNKQRETSVVTMSLTLPNRYHVHKSLSQNFQWYMSFN